MIKGRVEKKRKLNKKFVFLLVMLVIILLITLGFVFYFKYRDQKLLEDIKSHYNKLVVVNKDSHIFDKNNKIIGNVKKDFLLELESKKIINTSQKYFKVKDSSFYIYYEDVKKTDKKTYMSSPNNYLIFNSNIVDKKISFYIEGKEVLKVNDKLSLPIQYMDSEYYYVYYLNRLLQVPKEKNYKIEEVNNTSLNEASYVSVINYDVVDSCNKDSCVSLDNVKKQLDYLKDNGFYSISILEFKDWLDGNIRLKEKAILLTSNTDNDNLKNLNNEYDLELYLTNGSDLKFNFVNKKSTKYTKKDGVSTYLVKSSTSLDDFKKMSMGEDIIEPVKYVPTSSEQKIAVLNYHFFYDPDSGESCNEGICIEVSKFREQLDYLKNNGYKTLKMAEFKKWMYGEIELPEKSVLITIDDGAMGTGRHNGNKLIPILEEYNMNATLFLIAGWWDVNNYRSKNLDIQSHTYDMHQYGSCGKGQLVCASKEQALADLQTSLSIVDNNDSFCYPFYSYTDTAIQAVKEAGFKLAFKGGNVKARRSNDKFLIPRYPIYKTTSLSSFISMVS